MTITPGRYLLDAAGALHDIPPRRLVTHPVVAAVTVRLKQPVATPEVFRSMARKKPVVALEQLPPLSDEEMSAAIAEFRDRMDAAARRRRAGKATADTRPAMDPARLAGAFRSKAASVASKRMPTERAQRPNDCCARCGARGAAGCDHFLPCLPETGL